MPTTSTIIFPTQKLIESAINALIEQIPVITPDIRDEEDKGSLEIETGDYFMEISWSVVCATLRTGQHLLLNANAFVGAFYIGSEEIELTPDQVKKIEVAITERIEKP